MSPRASRARSHGTDGERTHDPSGRTDAPPRRADTLVVESTESEFLFGRRLELEEGEIAVVGRAIGCDVSVERTRRDRDDDDTPFEAVAPYQVRVTHLSLGRVRLEPMGGTTRANGFPLDHEVILGLGANGISLELAGLVTVRLTMEERAADEVALAPGRGTRRREAVTRARVRHASAWGTSMLLHSSLILLIAWLATTYEPPAEEPEPLHLGVVHRDLLTEEPTPESESADEETLPEAPDAPRTETSRAREEAGADTPDPVSPRASGDPARDPVGPGSIGVGPGGAGLTGRLGRGSGDARRSGARGPGRRSVNAALEWLAAHQMPDGTWTADDQPERCSCSGIGRPGQSYRAALTGLALVAFLREGHTHRQGDFVPTVRRALGALRKLEANDGSFAMTGRDRAASGMYQTAIAAWALCEFRARTGSSLLLERTRRAVDYLVRAQVRYSGWRYKAVGTVADTSVTGFVVLALDAARRAEIEVPTNVFVGARLWLDEVTDPRTGRVGYEKRGRGSDAMVATAILIRLLTGASAFDVDVTRGRQLLEDVEPEWRVAEKLGAAESDLYLWYFCAAAEHAGGKLGSRWSSVLRSVCLRNQESRGHEKGSWPSRGDRWAKRGGRVLATTLGALIVQETR